MFLLRTWAKHQAAIINHVRNSRKTRGMQQDEALVMQKLNITSAWDKDFIERFAPSVGQRSAEAFLIRTLQYVAKTDGMRGECRVPRAEFGPLVLSRVGDPVAQKIGEKVYDALLASGIAVLIPVMQPGSNTGVDTGDALPSPAVPLPSGPTPPSPGRTGPERHGGGSSAPPATTAGKTANGQGELTSAQRAGLLAACGALLGLKDLDPRVREQARTIDRGVRAGSVTAAAAKEFIDAVVWSREPARIAYLAGRKTDRGEAAGA